MSSNFNDMLQTIGNLLGAGILIGGVICLEGYLTRCRKCDKWFSEYVANKVAIKQEEGAKDLNRNDKHYDKDDNYTGKTTRK